MRDYYEQLWERLPEDLQPPDLAPRIAFARTGIRLGDRVLDLGCGQGDLTAELAGMVGSGARVVGVDVAQAAIDRARARHPVLRFELAPIDGDLPLSDGAFDVVWASEVIEHVADTGRWLSEIRRVLTRSGRLLLTTPDHGRLRLALHGIQRYSEPLGDHLHLYDARSLRAVLEDLDFSDIAVRRVAGPPWLRRLLTARAVR